MVFIWGSRGGKEAGVPGTGLKEGTPEGSRNTVRSWLVGKEGKKGTAWTEAPGMNHL